MSTDSFRHTRERLAALKAQRRDILEQIRGRRSEQASETVDWSDQLATLSRMDAQIAQLEAVMVRAIADKRADTVHGTVQLGSTVTVEVDGNQRRFVIVHTLEADPAHDRISENCALGRLLAGRRAGDTVTMQSGARPARTYRILAVR